MQAVHRIYKAVHSTEVGGANKKTHLVRTSFCVILFYIINFVVDIKQECYNNKKSVLI